MNYGYFVGTVHRTGGHMYQDWDLTPLLHQSVLVRNDSYSIYIYGILTSPAERIFAVYPEGGYSKARFTAAEVIELKGNEIVLGPKINKDYPKKRSLWRWAQTLFNMGLYWED
jgi:hypothetical protein